MTDSANVFRIVLVDDHHVVRRGLRSYLETFTDITVIGEAASGEEVLANLESWLPDVVLMDIHMPGGIDGLEATRLVRTRSPHTQVVVLTAHTDEARVIAALRMGAIGYLRKDAPLEILLAALRGAARGQAVLDPRIANEVLQELLTSDNVRPGLTEREGDVLRQLAHGRSNREIADLLVVTEETIKTHVGNILTKLHLAHRTQAALYALKRGLVTLDELEL